ncbi:MAG: YgaP-like transmembrane domain [Halobacteriota archaeon]
MEINVGSTDRSVRIVLGALLAVLGLAGILDLWAANVVVAAVLTLVGVVVLGTGLTRRCLLYKPFGIDTSNR